MAVVGRSWALGVSARLRAGIEEDVIGEDENRGSEMCETREARDKITCYMSWVTLQTPVVQLALIGM